MKKDLQRLNDVFASLGMPPVHAAPSKLDAEMMAEEDGGSYSAGYQDAQEELPTCDGKVCYPSFNRAERVKKRRMRRGKITHLCSYHCPKCKQWHLTSTKR